MHLLFIGSASLKMNLRPLLYTVFLSVCLFSYFSLLQKFQLPQSSSRWKRRLYSFLHNKLKLPGNHLVDLRPLLKVNYLLTELSLIFCNRYPFDGNFHSQSKDVGYYYLVVYLGTSCPQMGSWTPICKFPSFSWFHFFFFFLIHSICNFIVNTFFM